MACFKTKKNQNIFERLLRACRSNDLSLISNPNWKAKLQAFTSKDILDISNRFVTISVNGCRQTNTCLLLAAKYCGVDMIKYLIRHVKADVTICDSRRETALHKACRSSVEAAEKVEFIAENYPFMAHVKTPHGTLPVHLAARCDKLRCLEILINSDPTSVNKTTSRGLTALHVAAHFGCKNAVEFLLSWDYTDVNSQDLNGDTPAHHAANYKRMECLIAITEASNFEASFTNKKSETFSEQFAGC